MNYVGVGAELARALCCSQFFRSYVSLLQSTNYVTRRQSLKVGISHCALPGLPCAHACGRSPLGAKTPSCLYSGP
jgi:hypothetical protein